MVGNRLVPVARSLRRNQTPVEAKLWSVLRNRQLDGLKFRRQHPIGRYVADFCCEEIRLIIELDGSQHLDQAEYDAERTKYFESLGYKVIRFWNNDVMKDINGVIRIIQFALEK